MRRKKRPQYIQELVKDTNKRLETMNIKDEGDTLFGFMCDLLLQKDMYEGFHYFKKKNVILDGVETTIWFFLQGKSSRMASGIVFKLCKNKLISIWISSLEIV